MLIADLAREFIILEFSAEVQSRFLNENNAAAIERFMRNGFRYHVAEFDERVIGVVGVRDNKHLYHLFVATPFQGRGLGRRLCENKRGQAHFISIYRFICTFSNLLKRLTPLLLPGVKREGERGSEDLRITRGDWIASVAAKGTAADAHPRCRLAAFVLIAVD
jgi:acetyltransferase (GNAT) family protein